MTSRRTSHPIAVVVDPHPRADTALRASRIFPPFSRPLSHVYIRTHTHRDDAVQRYTHITRLRASYPKSTESTRKLPRATYFTPASQPTYYTSDTSFKFKYFQYSSLYTRSSSLKTPLLYVKGRLKHARRGDIYVESRTPLCLHAQVGLSLSFSRARVGVRCASRRWGFERGEGERICVCTYFPLRALRVHSPVAAH